MTPDDDQSGPARPAERPQRHRLLLFANFLGQHEKTLTVLSTTVTAIFTVVLGTSTAFLWKTTKDLSYFAQVQSIDMKDSIKATERMAAAAAASAKIAEESLAVNKDANVRQLRAYLSVGLGGVIKQDTAINYRFEVRMTLQNVGNTPAYKEVSNIHLGVLPFPLPDDFQFPELDERVISANVLGPRETYIITGIADHMYSDDDIHEIEFGSNKRLYAYGVVKYEDIFGVKRQTNFCRAIIWLKNNTFMNLYTPKYNDAD